MPAPVLARISSGVAAMMAGVLVLAWIGTQGTDRSLVPEPTGEKGAAGLERFYTQALSWTECGSALCTWVTVPVDYDAPDGDTLRLRLKLRPVDPDRRKGLVVVNPGGPGGSGVDYVDGFVSDMTPAMQEGLDVLGFDPRGVGRSTPLTCLDDEEVDEVYDLDPDPDTRDEVDALTDGFRSIGDACVEGSGELASHVSTEEVVRDLDVIRVLVGERDLDFYGASYGTQIGATYAELFPQSTGRLVLDGGIDLGLTKERQGWGQAHGFQRALRSFLRWCVDRGDCPMGDDVDDAETTYVRFLQDLDEEPLRTRSDRELTHAAALYGTAYGLYKRTSWELLLRAYVRATFGDGSIMLAMRDQYVGRADDGSQRDNSAQAVYAVRCLDFPEAVSKDEVTTAALFRYLKASPSFGRMMAWTSTECAGWPATNEHPQAKVTAKGAPPIVVIGTTRDPATPYGWSKALAKQLTSGVLLTREGDGHTGFGVGNRCVDRVVQRYLLQGEAPTRDLTCEDEAAARKTS